MKTKLIFMLFFICTISVLQAQDIIITRAGDEIKAKVTEVGINDVKYKKFGNETGPNYVIAKSDIFLIKYENGESDTFRTSVNTNTSVQNTPVQNTPVQNTSVQNNRQNNNRQSRYAEPVYAENQITKEYRHRYPWLSFTLSAICPGVGQYYNGHIAKGVVMNVLHVGSISTILGVALSSGYYDSSGNFMLDNLTDNQAATIGIACLIGIGNSIWSMIDAPVSAAVMNRRNQMLSWDLGDKKKLSITPGILSANTVGKKTLYNSPAYGLSMKLNF